MTQLIQIIGQRNNIYYMEVFNNETIEDIKILLSKKYNKEMSNFTIENQPVDVNEKISNISASYDQKTLIFEVLEQQIDPKNSQTQSNSNDNASGTLKTKSQKKLDPKMQSLVDKFRFEIGLPIKEDTIVDIIRSDFPSALGTDTDNIERIKAVQYFINLEKRGISDIEQFKPKDQKCLKKILKKTKLPLDIVAYVYIGNSYDKDKTIEHLNEFISNN